MLGINRNPPAPTLIRYPIQSSSQEKSAGTSRESVTVANHGSKNSAARSQLIAALTNAKSPSASAKVLTGTMAVVAVPINLGLGIVHGALKGLSQGSKVGNDCVPVIGVFPGASLGVAVGAVVQPIIDVKNGLSHARRGMGRYASINAGLSIKTKNIEHLRKVLSSIPDDRIFTDPATGNTIVNIKRCDQPVPSDINSPSNMHNTALRLKHALDGFSSRYDADGNYQVNITVMLEKMAKSKTLQHKIAIKAKTFSPETSSPSELSSSRTRDSRTSIYIRKGVQDDANAGKAGLQFIDQLAGAVDKNL